MTEEPRSRRERPAKAPLTRRGIVAAAVQVMRSEGMGRVTMRRLAKELDTGPASLYVYFRNTAVLHGAVLDDLLAGASTVVDDEVLDRIDEIVPPGTDLGPVDVAYQPPSLTVPERRRRPTAERAAA